MAKATTYKGPGSKNDANFVGNVRMPNMLMVYGGDLLMGTSDDDIKQLQLKQSDWAYDWNDNDLFENERPQHKVPVATFEIAQYPITNIEYYQFTSETGYRLPKPWNGFSFPDEQAYHPVTGVSKADAEAYIAWIFQKTRQQFRLPTEAEWEYAARGRDGRIYPWGNTFDPWRCNTTESAKKGTTPVGIYSPGGDSPCGAADMVGNVWEWTSSVFKLYDPLEDEEPVGPNPLYVVRGGAWYYSRKLARCAVREGVLANYSSHLNGFRLARTPQI